MAPDQLMWELALLLDQVIDKYGTYREAVNELQATERLEQLATTHEDARLAQGLSEDAAYMRRVVPRYQGSWSRRIDQWYRLWRALEAHIDAAPLGRAR